MKCTSKVSLQRLALYLTTVLFAGCQSLADYLVLPREGIRASEFTVSVEHDVAMKTSDGTQLVAEIFRPQTSQKTPTILVRIPFSRTFKNDQGMAAIGRFWASRGYTIVVQGSRGRYKSGGEYYPLRSERQDGIDTLHWLQTQPWFDGRLGMWGGSAFGYTQWVLSDQQSPGPSALMIQIASTNFHDMFYPGGAFSLESALFWAVRSRGAEDEDPTPEALERGFNGFPLIDADIRAVSKIGFFRDWASHRKADAYWKAIDGEQRARDLKAPVLLMAGWSDPFLPGQLSDFETIQRHANPRISENSRLIIGPWTHADSIKFPDGTTAGDYRPASLVHSIPWFDHHLLGQPLDKSLTAPVYLYVMGENAWRAEKQWPLARAQATVFYLRSNGHANSAQGDGFLSMEPPPAAERPDTFTYDPRDPVPSRGGAMLGPRAGIALQTDVEQRNDVLVYSSAPLDRDTEVTGPISAKLFVDTTAANTDFTVKLVDVHADGSSYNVTDGILRKSYARTGTDTKSTRPHEVSVKLWPTSMLFRRGHRIRIEVSSSNFPRYDRNPNTGRDIATETSPLPAIQTVHHANIAASAITLPLVPR